MQEKIIKVTRFEKASLLKDTFTSKDYKFNKEEQRSEIVSHTPKLRKQSDAIIEKFLNSR